MTLEKYLQEVKDRCINATEGEWSTCLGSGNSVCTGIHAENGEESIMICDTQPDYFLKEDYEKRKDHIPDMNFIAHARQDVPALVEMVEKLLKQRNFRADSRYRIRELEEDDQDLKLLIPTKEGE